MDRLDYDGERLLILKDWLPGSDPAAQQLNDLPLYLFPGEAAPWIDGRQFRGFQLEARADVAIRLRDEYPAGETPAFAAFVDQFVAARAAEAAILARPTVAVPYLPNYLKTLYPVQCKAIDFALRHRYVLWAMDAGLGKTVTALYTAQCLLNDKTVGRWLIISPVSALDDAWLAEAAEASVPLAVASGDVTGGRAPLVIVGREQLLTDLRLGRISLDRLSASFDGYILDESSLVRDPNNETYRVLEYLRPDARAMLLLNGTPVENGLKELFHQVDLVQPGKLGNWAQFKTRHGINHDRKPEWPEVEGLLAAELADVMFVGRLEDTGRELPPLHRKTLWVSLGPAQQAAYDDLARQFQAAGEPAARLALYTRMQQACNDLGLLGGDYQPGESAKRECLRELLPGLASFGRKSMLYSQSKVWSEALAREFSGPLALTYLGGMTRAARRVTKTAFWEGEQAFLWVNDAALRSINLQCVWNVVTLDLPWSAGIYQLVARARRGDTEHPVTWLRVLSDTPLERRKLALIETKHELLEGTVRSLPEAIQAGVVEWEELL